MVTFTWTEPRFFLEGSNASTSIGSYDYADISYQLVGDMVGNDFASATVFGSAVSQNDTHLAAKIETFIQYADYFDELMLFLL